MLSNQFSLLLSRRFLPLFVTQFLGAFNDNVFKNALVFLITYKIALEQGLNAQIIVVMAGGIFILPFFLFSAIAGQLADKLEKSRLIRVIKFVEILLMGLASVGFYTEDVTYLLIALFFMGSQSAFFGPLKYGILPDHLRQDELIGGNALIETGTFLSIILGLIVGGMLVLADLGPTVISAVVISMATLGFVASFSIPKAGPADPELEMRYNIFTETHRLVSEARRNRPVFLAILGISWFWFFGATFLTQFPTFGKDIIGGDEGVGTLFNCAFSLGIGLGSLMCNRLLKGEIHAIYVPIAAILMSVFSVDLYFASLSVMGTVGPELINFSEFLRHGANLRILFDLVMIATCGGVYIVPLYAILMDRSRPKKRSRMIAGNNIINALFMVVSAIGTSILLGSGFSIPEIFLVTALLNAGVALYICKLLPEELLRSITRALFRTLYRVEVRGLDNYKKAGNKAVVVANHSSYLDGALLGAFLPGRLSFAINSHIASTWWIKPAYAFLRLLPVDPASPLAAKTMIREVKKGRKVMIFPEGRLTVTGALMKVYEGPGTIAHLAGAPVLPIRIEGAQFTPFSRLKGKLRLRLFPKIIIHILEPVKFTLPEGVHNKDRRKYLAEKLYNIMSDLMFESSDRFKTLFRSLLECRMIHGASHLILEDAERRPMSYGRLIMASFILGRHMAMRTKDAEPVGILLPNSNGCAATFFATQLYGRIPAMLNFSAGPANLISACKTAQIKRVFTSRLFIEKAALEHVAEALEKITDVVYLEDIKKEIGIISKLFGLVAKTFPNIFYNLVNKDQDSAATSVILFTSGSEGSPKGVALSHENLQANCYQIRARVDFNPSDVFFNALPIFHCFGLTGGLLLPMLSGVKSFLYPSPLHYKIVPELVYDVNASIMFGTDTFLNGYARFAHAYDFYSMRYIFAGAERLKPETRLLWAEKFGVRVFEGYGATETAPVLAVNTPMHNKVGTVGQLLPKIEHRLEKVPGIAEGGRLIVRGPNVMKGYLKEDHPGELRVPEDGWYDTGDIVEVDAEGYVTIKGRAKRFAKIAGEMVSLTAVEALAGALWPENINAVMVVPDPRKGEQLVLVTDNKSADRQSLMIKIKQGGHSDLMLPRTILKVETVPVLGTGKIDYQGVARLVADSLG